jgi:hypothetical protein
LLGRNRENPMVSTPIRMFFWPDSGFRGFYGSHYRRDHLVIQLHFIQQWFGTVADGRALASASLDNETAKVCGTDPSCDFMKSGVKWRSSGKCKSSSNTSGLKSEIICIIAAKLETAPTSRMRESSANLFRMAASMTWLSSANRTLIAMSSFFRTRRDNSTKQRGVRL